MFAGDTCARVQKRGELSVDVRERERIVCQFCYGERERRVCQFCEGDREFCVSTRASKREERPLN